jgi:hypothetical protein
VRDNQLSREKALERLKKDEKVDIEVLKDLFDRNGLRFSDFEKSMEKARKYYSKGMIR